MPFGHHGHHGHHHHHNRFTPFGPFGPHHHHHHHGGGGAGFVTGAEIGAGVGLGIGLLGAAAVASAVAPPRPRPIIATTTYVPVAVPVAAAPAPTVVVTQPAPVSTSNAAITIFGTHPVNTQLGPFKVRSSAAPHLVLGVYMNNGAYELCMRDDDHSSNVKFFLRSMGDGSYLFLSALNPFKAIDLQSHAIAPGTHAILVDMSTSAPSQRWRMTQSQSGQPTALLSVSSGCVLECSGGAQSRPVAGTPLVLGAVSYQSHQMWTLEHPNAQQAAASAGTAVGGAPTYTPSGPILYPSSAGGAVPAPVYVAQPPPTYGEAVGSGSGAAAATSSLEQYAFVLRPLAHTGVTLAASSNANATPLGCTTNPDTQRFVLRASRRCPGWYMIEHVSSRLVLDIEGCSQASGARVLLFNPHEADNQLFRLSLHVPRTPVTLTAKHSNMVLEIELATGRVLQAEPNGGQNQAWFIEV